MLDEDFDLSFRGPLTGGQAVMAQMIATSTSGLLARGETLPADLQETVTLVTKANTIVLTILHVVRTMSSDEPTT